MTKKKKKNNKTAKSAKRVRNLPVYSVQHEPSCIETIDLWTQKYLKFSVVNTANAVRTCWNRVMNFAKNTLQWLLRLL